MAIILQKSSSTPVSNQNSVKLSSDPIESLKSQLSIKVFDGYCDETTFSGLIQYAVQNCGLDQKKAEIVLAMELESKGVANEKLLLTELDSLLHRFTDGDKKLDEKEKNDSIQFLCKARAGYTEGLSFEVANRYITTFCRNNRVKIKMGFLKWGIP